MNRAQIPRGSGAGLKGWLPLAITGLVALSAFLGGGALWWTSAQREDGYRALADAAANRQIHAANEQKLRDCVNTEPEAEACKARIEDESRKSEREIFDLEAQRTMAVWTRAMGIATIAGMTVAILTLGFIFLTLRATQRAAIYSGVAARQANRSLSHIKQVTATELRPYVAITAKDETIIQPFNRQSTVSLIVMNFGKTPATNVRLSVGDVLKNEPILDFQVPLGEKFGDYGLLAPGDFRTEHIGAGQMQLHDIADMIAKDMKMVIRVRIDYEWPGGTDFHDITLILDDPSISRWVIVDDRRRKQGPFN